MTFEEALEEWTETINEYYDLGATTSEVQNAWLIFESMDETSAGVSYVDTFFKEKDGTWSGWLDTVDRETLADEVSINRGMGPLPTYADVQK